MPNQVFANGQFLYGNELNSLVQVCANIAALQLFNPTTTDGTTIVAVTLGAASALDGGGLLYQWNSTSTTAANGSTVIQVTGITTGRWVAFNSSGANIGKTINHSLSPYTILPTDKLLWCDSTAGTVVLNPPTTPVANQSFFAKWTAGGNTVSFGMTIDGVATPALGGLNDGRTFAFNTLGSWSYMS